MGKAIMWGVIALVAGFWLGSIIAGYIVGGVVGIILGICAFTSSKKNNGTPPAWLWRTKKKHD